MQLTNMTLWAFAGLATSVVGVLTALHYLRIRPSRLRVVTTLFWQQAAEDSKAHTLLQRFRYPLTYLLLLAISLLLLLAVARPVLRLGQRPYRVIILEAGLGMSAPDNRFEKALALVRSEAASAGEDRVAVIVADPEPRLIKRLDESLGVMKRRLSGLQPAKDMVAREDALRIAKSVLEGRGSGEIVIVVAQPPAEHDPSIRVLAAGDVYSNAFVLSACFNSSPSDPTRGEFRCLVGYNGKGAGTITIKMNQPERVLVDETVTLVPGAIREFSAPVAADGSVVTVKLSGDDAIAGDSNLQCRLPNRKPILITAEGLDSMPKVLQSVVANLAETATDTERFSGARVIRVGPLGSGTEVEVQAAAAGDWEAVIATDHSLVSGLVFEDAACRVPRQAVSMEQGSVPLLYAGGKAIVAISSDGRKLTVSDVILDPEASLVRRTGYLVFWSNVFRHLAEWDLGTVMLQPNSAQSIVVDATDNMVLKSDMNNFNVAPQSHVKEKTGRAYSSPVIWQVLLGIGILLMTVEAVLNIRGRIA